jgi:hypothetical protein
MRRLPVLLLALVCAGCADDSWRKDGVSDDRRSQDLAACERGARDAVRRDQNIDSDILASRGHDWSNAGVLTLKRDQMQSQTQAMAADILRRCMRTKGYTPATGDK